jgi:hypothetical protein
MYSVSLWIRDDTDTVEKDPLTYQDVMRQPD